MANKKEFALTEETLEYVQPNGFCFHAVHFGLGATWARARDPITAIRHCAFQYPSLVGVAYGKFGDLNSTDRASFNWGKIAPVPVGVFVVTATSIKPLSKRTPKKLRDQLGAVESDFSDHWIDRFHKSIEQWRDRETDRRKKQREKKLA